MTYKNKLKIPYKPVVLLVLDGFGVNLKIIDSPWKFAKHPAFEEIEKFYPFITLQASGIAVGLPWKEEGNSEVGHLTLGAGRIVYIHLPRISVSIQDGSFFQNEAFLTAVKKTKRQKSKLHYVGLFSSGSVHASSEHLEALLKLAKENLAEKVFLHLFTDGRDAPSKEAAGLIEELEKNLEKNYPQIKIASLMGRDLAMDRDNHWDKIETAYRLLTEGRGEPFKRAPAYLNQCYEKNISDEFIPPAVLVDENNQTSGIIQNGDAVVFFNFREDSMREIASALTKENFTYFKKPNLADTLFVTMTEYEKEIPALVAFPPINIERPLARIISEAGLKQLHIAETEKYAHVTYFFNGGREALFPGEERILIASPRAPHFDETPEMSADKITEAVIQNLAKYDFILANFANADMVGHSGNFDATVKALEVLDFSAEKIISKVLEIDGALIITGDHGNAEEKLYQLTGEKKTKHSINPVPFYLVVKDLKSIQPLEAGEIKKNYQKIQGSLTDAAPTILELMELSKPEEMTGVSLLNKIIL